MRQLNIKLSEWLETVNEQVALHKAQGVETTPISAREGLANLTRTYVEPGPEMPASETLVSGNKYNVPVRIYLPENAATDTTIIFCHGGGQMSGSVSVYDPICRRIADACASNLVSVEYRRSPENPHPAGVEDLLAVVRGLGPALDRKSVAHQNRWILMGDSGGGAITAAVTRLLQHEQHNITAQVLIYPSLDYTLSMPSIVENGSGYLLEKDKIDWYFDNNFQGAENRWSCSPLHGEFTKNLPSTLMITAEFCPLRDEGIAYGKKLREVNVPLETLHLEDMIHTFLNLESLVPDACAKVYRHIGEFVRKLE
jgi:acetyl esterase/lipase